MCGIAGFINKNNISNIKNVDIANNMISTLKHRGPDHKGILYLENEGITFLHRRLSIIDLSIDANQPMESDSGRLIITYNGEIYNYLEIKKELSKLGFKFKTSSDTEVLLSSIECWGIDAALNKVIGMFAFAIYDRKLSELTLVRDRFGEKPLYYSNINNELLFASELKALKSHPSWLGIIDKDSLNLYLKYSYVPSPKSIYKNVYKLNPGTYIKFKVTDNQCKEILHKKWHYVKSIDDQFKGSYQEALKITEKLIIKSINYQKISDVPIGAFLSGGIDSTLITTLMRNNTSTKTKTFTIGYNEKLYDESIYAKKIANHLGTEHHEWIVNENEITKYIPNMSIFYDEPFADSSQLPTFLISKFAQKKVKVSLTGDAGDELFGGYNRYLFAPKVLKLKKYPLVFRKMISNLILKGTPSQWDNLSKIINKFIPSKYHFSTLSEKLYKISDVIKMNSEFEIYDSLVSTWKNQIPSLFDNSNKNYLSNEFYESGNYFEQRMMRTDFNNYLVDDILVKVDRAAMANSLETRVPFLDSELVNFATSLPLSMKISKNGKSKSILRDILYKYVPPKMIERPKAGFGVPIDLWLKGSLKEWANDLISKEKIDNQNYLNFELIDKTWKQHLSGESNNHHKLWNILMFQNWLEIENK